ncbi:MATE efflux family protein [Nadsonia fulvescens var. elongata DSM 6958]|uniref:MATE efflux family protein n=1 Tax=Nadsonia fulvescens var. elongata DSM 6958 TaxID=857566 RepID=A0A1E3PIB2_9ASCO|nr:MATE efflux family protein [Nadsonia fulvescens var. elongata DSM 6958]
MGVAVFDTDDLLRNDDDLEFIQTNNNSDTCHSQTTGLQDNLDPVDQDLLNPADDNIDYDVLNNCDDDYNNNQNETRISSTHSSPIVCPTNVTTHMGTVSKSHPNPVGHSFTSMSGSSLVLSHSQGFRSPRRQSVVFGSVGRTGFGFNSFHKQNREATLPSLSSLQREVRFEPTNSSDSPMENTKRTAPTSHYHYDTTVHQFPSIEKKARSSLSANKYLHRDDPLYVITDQSDTEPLIASSNSKNTSDTIHNISLTGYGAFSNDNNSVETNSSAEDLTISSKVWDGERGGLDLQNDPEFLTNDDKLLIEHCHTTSYKREIIVLGRNAAPLTITFLLQYSLTVASVFSVGHLGKDELGAVSLACMTANVTGFALFQGLATCLDTMCAQAYGAGHFDLVGLYFQRCTLMILLCFIPVAFMWIFSGSLLGYMIKEENLVRLAAQYLRILCFGAPGFIIFETGKRFVQAQGIFSASTFVLLICGPLNAILNYVLVWNSYIGIGYAGAPLAVAITNWLMPLLLFIYVYFIDGMKCWKGFSRAAFTNWGPMAQLAIPGVIMVEAEFLAFEVLTFVSSYFGTAALAAQSVVSTITALTYQIPFAMAIAASTRIANLIGAELKLPASMAANTAIVASSSVAIFNTCLLFTFRNQIGKLFSDDDDVIELVSYVMPLAAFGQVFDATSAVMAGILRGQGKQYIGGYLNLFFYYAIAIPLSLLFAFTFDMGLLGLWAGIICGVGGIAGTEMYVILETDWDQIILESKERDSSESTVCN